MRKLLQIIALVLLLGAAGYYFLFNKQSAYDPNAGSVDTGIDLYRLDNLKANQIIESPFIVRGEMRGFWFFEASFPIRLLDASNKEITVAIAQAQSNWMTVDLVPFEAKLEFKTPATPTGTIVLQKDNPSGLPENDQEVRIPIRFR